MATPEVRRLRNQLAATVREFEGHLLRLEGQLLALRAKAQRAGEDAQSKLAGLLAQTEREVEAARELGRTALAGLERATDAARTCLADLKGRLDDTESRLPAAVAKGREVVRRAAIEAKAIRHGVRVGLRVARRVSRRTKAAKG
jgi:phage shock protein A